MSVKPVNKSKEPVLNVQEKGLVTAVKLAVGESITTVIMKSLEHMMSGVSAEVAVNTMYNSIQHALEVGKLVLASQIQLNQAFKTPAEEIHDLQYTLQTLFEKHPCNDNVISVHLMAVELGKIVEKLLDSI